jgi:hypothetical protein
MGRKRKETPDFGVGAVRGLYEVTQPSGRKSWAFRYRFGGKSSKYTIGPSPEISRKEARIFAHKAIIKRAEGIDPAAERRAQREANRQPKAINLYLVEVVAARFLKRHCAKLRPATQAEAKRYMARITKAWEGRPLSSITKPMIHALLDSITDAGKPVAANRCLTWFGVLCNWAMQRDIIKASPCAGIERPTEETARARILRAE